MDYCRDIYGDLVSKARERTFLISLVYVSSPSRRLNGNRLSIQTAYLIIPGGNRLPLYLDFLRQFSLMQLTAS